MSSNNAKSAIAATRNSKFFQSTCMSIKSKTQPKAINPLKNNPKCDILVPTIFSLTANTHLTSKYDVNFLSHRKYHTSTHNFESKKNDSERRTQKNDDPVSSLYDRVKKHQQESVTRERKKSKNQTKRDLYSRDNKTENQKIVRDILNLNISRKGRGSWINIFLSYAKFKPTRNYRQMMPTYF